MASSGLHLQTIQIHGQINVLLLYTIEGSLALRLAKDMWNAHVAAIEKGLARTYVKSYEIPSHSSALQVCRYANYTIIIRAPYAPISIIMPRQQQQQQWQQAELATLFGRVRGSG